MKKSVFACLLALATIFPGSVSMVYAQGAQSGQITIKDPAEYNDYTNAIGQATPAAKAAAIEAFLTKYPNSVVKSGHAGTAHGRLTRGTQPRCWMPRTGCWRLIRETCGHSPPRFTWRRPKPTLRPIQPMHSPFSIKPLPRPRPASTLPSRPT